MDRRLRRPRRTDEVAGAAGAPLLQSTQPSQLPVTRRTLTATATAATGPATRTRASPSRNKAPPSPDLGPRTRRSSRPRSSVGPITGAPVPAKASIKVRTPIREVPEVPSPVRQSTNSSLPLTLTTNTSSRAPNKSFNTSSLNSGNYISSSSTTTTTTTSERIEIRAEGDSEVDTDSLRKRITERLRRSVSKTISNLAGTPVTNTEDGGSRYSRSVSRSVYDDEKSSKRSYSTGEEDIEEEELEEEEEFRSFNATRKSATPAEISCRQLKAPQEFGGWLGAFLLLLLVPTAVYYLTWSCTARNACQLKHLNPRILLDVNYLTRQVFQPHVVAAFATYHVVAFVLVALLPGRRVHLTRETYKFNSLAVASTFLIAGGIAEYLKYPVVAFVLRHYLRFCIYGLIGAFVAAAWSYWLVDNAKYNVLRQTLTNDYGKSGSFVVDFALGRQLNPKWLGRVDWKQFYYRLSLVSTLLYAACYVYQTLVWPQKPQLAEQEGNVYLHVARYYWNNVNYDAGTLLSASCLILYVLDAIVFEHHLSSSFELQHEGYGCLLLLRYAATPYLLSSVTKYFYEQRVPIACWYAPIGVGALLCLGLLVKRYSCAYKYKYRLNAQSPIFANIETIHTYQGSRLLLSGMWGWVRQPNYLGDILALLALAAPMALRPAWPPVLGLALIVLLLLHRTTRANARNLARYHSSWQRYSTQVRSYILPKVY
ncbi:lamin-B receptor [Drosophila kikkawai]|uniref:Lamin-B receptor n=1 Tax=Drosophila kikkawai TaxID=30033 RepID=A0A6P4I845_DROKI|nr:lamin-B receptor [Drosophila kikkawai]XP_017018936.1 lamin-B receptor [Drosophila kikkawai]XP_041632800.1 lamin-B receptor [Drosophila kikkawai]